METHILFFGTKKGYDRFVYENVGGNVKFILCTRLDQARGRAFDGYIVHYTADNSLRRSVNEVSKDLDRLSQKVRSQDENQGCKLCQELTKKLPTAKDIKLLKEHFSYQDLNQEGKRIEELFTSLPTK